MKAFILAILSSLVLISCSSDTTDSNKVSQDEIHQYYSIRYNDETRQTNAWAEFRIGGSTGTTVLLQSPSTIRFNGRELDRGSFLGTHYSLSFEGPLQFENEWTYVNNDGKSFVNSIKTLPVRILSEIRQVSRDRSLKIDYEAPNLTESESIDAEIRSQNGSSVIWSSIHVRGISTSFEGRQLATLPAGPASLVLKRAKRSNLQNATKEGGSIYSEFISKKTLIVIE